MTVVVSAAASIGAFVYLLRNVKIVQFLVEVLAELKKVVWPGQKETAMSTIVVLILVLITAVILWVFDFMWSSLLRVIVS